MKKRVLLIGGNGFIGSHLMDELLGSHYAVRVLDRSIERFRQPLTDVEYIQADYSDINAFKKALNGCDTVIHLAHIGTPATQLCHAYQEVLDSFSTFVNMLDWLKGGLIDRFMFFSSGGAVYGAPVQTPASETYKGWPISPYGVAKLNMEHYLHMFSHLNHFPYQIVRPSNPYGPRQAYQATQGVIAIFMHRILHDLPIEIWGNGDHRKDYIHVGDLSRAVHSLLQYQKTNDIYNIGGGEGHSINELISMIEEVCGKKASISYQPERPQDVKEIILSNKRINQATGWAPSIDIRDGLNQTYEWMKTL